MESGQLGTLGRGFNSGLPQPIQRVLFLVHGHLMESLHLGS